MIEVECKQCEGKGSIEVTADCLQPAWNCCGGCTEVIEDFTKAKEIEKQQIERAFMFGQYTVSIENGEQYYNETFKNK